MSIDFAKLNAAREAIEARLNRSTESNRPSIIFWKAKSGTNSVRILPPWSTDGEFAGVFFREVHQHWGVSEEFAAPILCTRNTPGMDEECPICDFIDELRSMKDDVKALTLAKAIRSKGAFLLNIVDLKDPTYTEKDIEGLTKEGQDPPTVQVGDLKVQVFSTGPTVFNQILTSITSNETDITDPLSGHDIDITKTGSGIQNTKYVVTMKLKPTALKGFTGIEQCNALDKVGTPMEKSKILEILGQGKGGEFRAALPSGSSTTVAKLPSAKTDGNEEYGISEEATKNESNADADDLSAKLKAALRG